MKDKRIVFMGTPEYSVPVLEMLIENTNVIAVVTQPDKEVGRKRVLTPCAVKSFALSHNIKVMSFDKLRDNCDKIIELNPDMIVTCAYGQIIPEELIYAPRYDTVNVHASLLPKYRGGAPIQRAIMNGDAETGITIMYTDKGMDSGDIIKKEKIAVDINDTYDIVSRKMSLLGSKLLKEVLPDIFLGKVQRIKQDDQEKTLAPIIKKEDEHIDFSKTALEVHNKIRGLSSVPGAYAFLDNDRVKIYLSSLDNVMETSKEPGTVTRVDKDSIYIACGDREIGVKKIQFSGKKAMFVKDYLNGLNSNKIIDRVLK